MRIRLPFSLLLTAFLMISSGVWGAPIEFQRDVQPILAEHCLLCHGMDSTDRKSGLRLDLRDAALKGGESGAAAIVPGQPDQGELVKRIKSTDPDVVMPPPSHNKALSAKQIEVLRQWVREGAKYEAHWAFSAPVKQSLPDAGLKHPVDAIVVSRLKERGLAAFRPKLPSAALCRRLYLDLIGLPPSPQELVAFEQQGLASNRRTRLAQERTVWRKVGSTLARRGPLFGQQWLRKGYAARTVEVGETAWVVDAALNRDLPYDQFLIEQLARGHASQCNSTADHCDGVPAEQYDQ